MKTKITSQTKGIFFNYLLKKIPALMFFLLIVIGISRISAQRIAPEKEVIQFNMANERDDKIERYSARLFNGVAYLNWHVQDEREEGIFVIQRSQNMLDFKIVGIKEDVPTERNITLMFSFADKKPLAGISYYRILRIYKDNSYYYSNIETMDFSSPQPKEQLPITKPTI